MQASTASSSVSVAIIMMEQGTASGYPTASNILTANTSITYYHCDKSTLWDRDERDCIPCQEADVGGGDLEVSE